MYDFTWFLKAVELDDNSEHDAALDIIYDTLDDLIIAGEYDNVDCFLDQLKVENFCPNLLYGISTITFYAAEHLPSRALFVNRVNVIFKDKGLTDLIQSNILSKEIR